MPMRGHGPLSFWQMMDVSRPKNVTRFFTLWKSFASSSVAGATVDALI
jgi:hypothetical protein